MSEAITSSDWQMWVTIAIIAVIIVLYSLDRFSMELISAGSVVSLLVFFHFFPIQMEDGYNIMDASILLSGFASPALFAILGLLIIGQGMFQSGALEYPTRMLVNAYGKNNLLVIGLIFIIIIIVSAFLNNTPVVVMFIPIMSAIATQSKVAPSKFMIPLSFMSIFGGMLTVIGSSTNLLAVETYMSVTGKTIGFFDLAPIGLVMALIGGAYLVITSKWLLPSRDGPDVRGMKDDGKQFIAQIQLSRGHPLIGRSAVAGLFPDLPEMTVRLVQRREEALLPPYDDFTFRLHDTVILAATRKSLTTLLKSRPEILAEVTSEIDIDENSSTTGELTMVEAIVAPGSRIIGRSISQIGFKYQTNCVILGIQRRSRMIREEMSSIRLEAGDVLLIVGDISDLRALRSDRDIVILEWSMSGLPEPGKARIAGLIFGLVVGSAALNVLPIAIAAFLGATAMVASGCLNIRQAARAIDRRIFMLIGSALAMGISLEYTGGANYIGQLLVSLASIGGSVMLISTFFILSASITNVLSNNATAVLFTPIAVNAALQAQLDPLILVLTVIFGANCSFATPVSYQTNLLVMAPGHYKFRDYVVIGVPLIILLWISYTILAPLYFKATGLL